MQYKLLVSDFDNTLVPFGEPKPRPAVVKAVKKLQAAGVKFALSTGRAYPCVHREQLGGIRPDYIVTCNGACVTDSQGHCGGGTPPHQRGNVRAGGFLRGLQLPAAVQFPGCLLCVL